MKAMSETLKIILFILFVIGGLFFALRITGWKMKKASDIIIRDLKEKKALDPTSAAELPYAKSQMFRIGLRDYRPAALQELIKQDAVRIAEGGGYYLRGSREVDGPDDRAAST
jgi:hypothetical protein